MLLLDNSTGLKGSGGVRMDPSVALTRLAFLVKEVHVKTKQEQKLI